VLKQYENAHEVSNRHAYIVIAHNNFYVLEKLLLLLDGPENDIYLHVDKKIVNFDFHRYARLVHKSRLFFPENRLDVQWGDFSQVECELNLFEEVVNRQKSGKYAYIHLLSGACLPIKTRDQINDFFRRHSGKEFIKLNKSSECSKKRSLINRVSGWGRIRVSAIWPFRGAKRDRNPVARSAKHLVNSLFIALQRAANYDRLKSAGLPFGWGSNWVSITSELAEYIISQRALVERVFRWSYCPDEHFIQTLVVHSEAFRGQVFEGGNMRFIDWRRGRPYTFRSDDFDEIMSSPKLFARKFDEKVDKDIVDRIYARLSANT